MQIDPIHSVPDRLEISTLDARVSFNQLDPNERLYAYYMYKASWAGASIVASQISIESPKIVDLFLKIFSKYNIYKIDIDENLVNYVAQILGEAGNYQSCGDSKIIPRITKDQFRNAMLTHFPDFLEEYDQLEEAIFSLQSNEKFLGYGPDNVTTYFSANMTREDALIVDRYITQQKLEGWNTTASKVTDEQEIKSLLSRVATDHFNTPDCLYVIHLASIKSDNASYDPDTKCLVVNGKYSKQLTEVCKYLEQALPYVANENQRQMIEYYIKHFTSGRLEDHKTSQRYWVSDKQPTVETNIGFIENYRDPSGMRAEFESFVAFVDKKKTAVLQELVRNAEHFLGYLPWPKTYEKDKFNAPDFTSLNVLVFCGSGIPAGINIPNYDDIRQTFGFKNVSLENAIKARQISNELPKWISPSDGELFNKYQDKSYDIDVAGHELLGHGSGKLFSEDESGVLNFDPDTINPITGQRVASWYKPGETWSSKFGKLSNAYEECRAECVGLLFSNVKAIHEVFAHSDLEWDNIRYVSWIWMVRAGVLGLAAYDPDKSQWLQAHCQARYVIYRILREAGLVSIELEGDNFTINVDRTKLDSVGLMALKAFLLKLNVYKALADYENGSALFNNYSTVDDDHLRIREIYLLKKRPREILVQPTLQLVNDKVWYVSYDATPKDLIQSFVDKLV